MASMFKVQAPILHLLDAGAGVGSLSAAWVAEVCGRSRRPGAITVTAYEIEAKFIEYLTDTLAACQKQCDRVGVEMRWEVVQEDFIEAAVDMLSWDLFSATRREFTCAIMNPPYRKIHGDSIVRHRLRQIGIETGNLYTAFLALAVGVAGAAF
jgi:adenine-specific DNA-methyltransferase